MVTFLLISLGAVVLFLTYKIIQVIISWVRNMFFLYKNGKKIECMKLLLKGSFVFCATIVLLIYLLKYIAIAIIVYLIIGFVLNRKEIIYRYS